jgi:hypothetical protein
LKNNIRLELDRLEQQIQTRDISKEAGATIEWGGADVIIKDQLDDNIIKWLGEQPLVISIYPRIVFLSLCSKHCTKFTSPHQLTDAIKRVRLCQGFSDGVVGPRTVNDALLMGHFLFSFSPVKYKFL